LSLEEIYISCNISPKLQFYDPSVFHAHREFFRLFRRCTNTHEHYHHKISNNNEQLMQNARKCWINQGNWPEGEEGFSTGSWQRLQEQIKDPIEL